MLTEKWAGRYKNKFVWRNRGIQQYVNSIDDEVLKDMISSSMNGTIAVSLYGKSQVGKTTFTLELMGVKEKYFSDLYIALRCGKPIGNSATPTAMIYRKSDYQNFRIKEGLKEWVELDFSELTKHLVDLSKRIESNEYCDLTEVIIEIPKFYFKDDPSNMDFQICDLTGYGSKTQAEIEHVNKILKKYLPASGLILVFVEGFQITSASDLFENGIMDELYGWKYFASRYRQILTKSYSSESIRELIKSNDNFSKADILNHYRQQASLDKAGNVPDEVIIYPLEFGDTYKGLILEYSAEQLSSIDNIMAELWVDLKKDIQISSKGYNQIKIMQSIPFVIDRIRKEYNLKIDKEIENESGLILIHDSEISVQHEYCENKNEEIETLIEISNKIKKSEKFNAANYYNGELIRDNMLSHIKMILDQFINRGNFINSSFREINSNYSIPVNQMFDVVQYEIFSFISQTLRKIKKNTHFLFMGPEDWHKNNLNETIGGYNNKISEYNNDIDNYIQSWIDKIIQDINSLKNQIIISKETISYHNKEKQIIHANIDVKKSMKLKKNEMYNRAYEETNRINDCLWDEVKAEKKEILNNLRNKPPVDVFLDMMYYALIIKEYEIQTIVDK